MACEIGFYIKKIIYSLKKFVYDIFGCKIVIKNINEFPPEVIINSILFAAHQEYSEKRKKIVITKAVKLIIKSIEDINYQPISYGCFKYGEFSFAVHNITKEIFVTRSLHGAHINKDLVNFDIVEMVRPGILKLKPIMTGTWKKFLKYAHEDRIPQEFQDLYKCHDVFRNEMENVNECKKSEIGKFYQIFSDIISNFDSNLNHVDENNIHLYFDYMDLLEGVLLVNKNRDTNFKHVKEVISDFNSIYDNEISAFIFPYLNTLKGDNIDYEKMAFLSNSQWKKERFIPAFQNLKTKVKEYKLIPTLEDMDSEIEKSLNEMTDEEKLEFLDLLASN